jgi:homeobox protein cut-like
MDELIQERVTQKENELNAEYDERMRNYEERYVGVFRGRPSCLSTSNCQNTLTTAREKDLQRQVTSAKSQLRDLHSSNESTQAKLMDASQRQGTSPSSRPGTR